MAKKKDKRIVQDDAPGGLTHNPFAALRPSGTPAEPVDEARDASDEGPSAANDGRERIVVRREKKGRAGKTVTRVSGLELARELKRALGCGASVEDGDVILQGSLTERAAEWLERERGAKVRIGN